MSNVGKIAKAQRVIAGLMSLILGKKSTVEWGRSAACGEDGVIGLPRPKTGDAEEIALLTRLAVHEAGHDKHTDFSAVEGLDGNVMALMNALEDPRIEREQVKSFPGAGLILNRGLEDSIRLVDAALDPSNPAHSADLVTVNVLLKGYRKLVPHEAMKSGADGLVAKGDQLLGVSGVAAVDQAIDRLAACKSTAEAAALAQDLWQSLQPEEPEQQDQQSTDTPDQQDQQDQSDTGESDQVNPESTPESDAPKTGESDESEKSPQSETSEDPESPPQGESNSGNDSVDDAADAGGDADGKDGQPDASQPEANGNAQKEEPSPSGDGAADEGEANQDAQSDAGAANSQTQTGSPNADGHENSQQDAHNQESGGGGSTPNAEKGENPDGGTGQASKLDLSTAKGGDLGTLLEMAYEQKFGKPDVDAPGQSVEATTATDDMTKLVAAALEQASDDGESLEKALELIEAALEVVSSSEQDESDDDAQSSSGAGGGNATGVGTALDAKANLNGAVSRLVRIFTKELQDKRRRNVKLAPAGGLVASNRVWRLSAMGDTNVFRVTTSTGGIDAAVMVFLDRSASMGPCIVDAAKAALACTQALERISKVKTSIEMFPGFAGDVDSTVTLQAFGQSARQVVKRVSEVDAEGGTPLAEALHEAIPRLLAQRVKKRFAFLITDGIPNNKVAALAEIEKAEAMGVEFVGIGIGEYGVAIEGLTPFSVCINEASELPDAFEKLFRGNLALKLAA